MAKGLGAGAPCCQHGGSGLSRSQRPGVFGLRLPAPPTAAAAAAPGLRAAATPTVPAARQAATRLRQRLCGPGWGQPLAHAPRCRTGGDPCRAAASTPGLALALAGAHAVPRTLTIAGASSGPSPATAAVEEVEVSGTVAEGSGPPAAAAAAATAAAAGVLAGLRRGVAEDAPALAALDAGCAADGSSGWSEGVWRSDLRPDGPNLVLLCVLRPGMDEPKAAPSAVSAAGHSPAVGTSKPAKPAPLSPAAADAAAQGAAPGAASSLGPDGCCEAAAAAAEATGAAGDTTDGRGEGRVVALVAGCEAGGEVSLTNLAVAPELRGRGVGRALAAELLRRLGAERFPSFLEVRADNAAAQALYGRLGFAQVGRRKRYNADGSDSLVLRREPGPLA